MLGLLIVAQQMSDKHEAAPTAMKPPGEFRDTVKIGSASSWNKVTLSLFHVDFNKAKYSDLRTSKFITEKYFQPPTKDEECYNGNLTVRWANGRLRRNHAGVRGGKRRRHTWIEEERPSF